MGDAASDQKGPFIGGVPTNAILDIIPRIAPLLRRVITKESGYTVESVLSELLSGETQLWVINDFETIHITRVQHRPLERVLWMEWSAGENMLSWVDAWVDFQEAIAKAHNCTSIEFQGRMGYKRHEKLHGGYKPLRILYRREL